MFRQDGRWKEFGINGVDTTYMPFWLFCIIWAVVAYAIIRMLYSDESPSVAPKRNVSAEPLSPLPVPENKVHENTTQGKPGYYKLDDTVMKEKGVPRYVYIGAEKPADLEDSV